MPQFQKQVMPEEIAAQRRVRREQFLAALGWKNVTMQLMPADASFRRYYRLQGTPKPMLLMEDPPDRPPVTPFVMVEPYIKIGEHLRAMGLRTPEIYHRDIANGLLVIEDFGDDTYTRLFEKGSDPQALYERAVDVLVHLHRHPKRHDIAIPKYDDALLIDGAMLLMDWYYPALIGKKPTEEMKQSYTQVLKSLLAQLPKDQETLVLRDYHVDNLMLVSDAKGIQACGLLDFQDAATGQFSYDLMSLLEDARRDVPKPLKDYLYERYLKGMGEGLDRQSFDYSFRVLAAIRHARILGVFVRLFKRDGKERYLQFIPHVHKLFNKTLENTVLLPLKLWFQEHNIDMKQEIKKF